MQEVEHLMPRVLQNINWPTGTIRYQTDFVLESWHVKDWLMCDLAVSDIFVLTCAFVE